jgi:hypothetical protein
MTKTPVLWPTCLKPRSKCSKLTGIKMISPKMHIKVWESLNFTEIKSKLKGSKG